MIEKTIAIYVFIDDLPKKNNITALGRIELSAVYEEFVECTGKEAYKILKQKIPDKFRDIQLNITCLDYQRNIHSFIVKFNNEEVITTPQ